MNLIRCDGCRRELEVDAGFPEWPRDGGHFRIQRDGQTSSKLQFCGTCCGALLAAFPALAIGAVVSAMEGAGNGN